MRINHNISSMITQGALSSANQAMSQSLEKLSTGLRINQASDDAAGLGVSENLRSQVNGTSQAMRNAQDGIAALNVGEGASNEISAVLQRMRELAVQSANDTLTTTERQYTDNEYQSLMSEVDRIANVTNYNNMTIISSNGTSAGDRFGFGGTAGNTGSALWVDANDKYGLDSITATVDTLTTDAIGLTGTDLTTQANSVTAITDLTTAINSVNQTRSYIGALVNRLDHAVNNLTVSNTNQQAAESDIRDADFAQETSTYTKNQILVQSSTAMLAQSNALPQSVLQLIGK